MSFYTIQKDMGPLHRLLLQACPPERGKQSIPLLAKKMGFTSQSIYEAIRKGSISAEMAWSAVNAGNLVTFEDFIPYLIKQGKLHNEKRLNRKPTETETESL